MSAWGGKPWLSVDLSRVTKRTVIPSSVVVWWRVNW